MHDAAAGLDEDDGAFSAASATFLRTQQGTMLSVPVALLLVQAAPGGGALSSRSRVAIAIVVAGSLPFSQVRGDWSSALLPSGPPQASSSKHEATHTHAHKKCR